jgi:uncharacterized protein YaeQ
LITATLKAVASSKYAAEWADRFGEERFGLDLRSFAQPRSPSMALPSTTYKIELNLTDIDRSVYENLRFTVAKHPSETEERLASRLVGYALFYHEHLAFGRGLSDVDEPALWEKSLDDRVLHWIEVGQPDSDRITWCSRRTEKFSLVAYGNLRVWQIKVLDPVRSLKNINVVALDQEALAKLALDMPRSLNWSVMISDGELFITDERGQHELPIEWLIGER